MATLAPICLRYHLEPGRYGSPFNGKGINLEEFKAENFKDILDALTEFERNVISSPHDIPAAI
jgi:hypothetical protein